MITYRVKFVTIGGVVLYEITSNNIDEIISSLNDAMIKLNIVRIESLNESFQRLETEYLTQDAFLKNAKLNGIYMNGGCIDGKYIELQYMIL